jgi:enoyl-CoA hydratase/carnithine racemase
MARMADMMFTGRVITSGEGLNMGISQYLTADSQGLTKGIEIAKKISCNTRITNYALMHVLPRITEGPQEQASMLESLIAAISANEPEAKERMKDFLSGKAKKVGE